MSLERRAALLTDGDFFTYNKLEGGQGAATTLSLGPTSLFTSHYSHRLLC